VPEIQLQFPDLGYNKNWALSEQPPRSSPFMVNMRPYDPIDERRRGGTSPTVFWEQKNQRTEAFGVTFSPTSNESDGCPPNANLACVYRGRGVVAKGSGAGEEGTGYVPSDLQGDNTKNNLWDDYQWAMSRQGDFTDWVYCANDAQTPIAGSCSDCGRLWDRIIALIPFSDDYLVFGCLNSMWVLRGDPAWGGSIDVLTNTEGILGRSAYCFDMHNNLYYASNQGLIRVAKGMTSFENLSKDKVPDIFKGLNPSNGIILQYDEENMGINIYSSPGDNPPAGYGQWYYDLRTEGFFPEGPSYGSSRVVYGPINMGGEDFKRGRVTQLTLTTGGSYDIRYRIYTANSAVELYDDVVGHHYVDSGIITANSARGPVAIPNSVGNYAAVELRATTTSFIVDNLTIRVEPSGQMLVSNNNRKPTVIEGDFSPGKAIYGPFPMIGGGFGDGKMTQLAVTKGADNTSKTAYIYSGNSETEVWSDIDTGTSAAKFSQTVSKAAGRKVMLRPRVRGAWGAIVFETDTIEQVSLNVEPAGGRLRV